MSEMNLNIIIKTTTETTWAGLKAAAYPRGKHGYTHELLPELREKAGVVIWR